MNWKKEPKIRVSVILPKMIWETYRCRMEDGAAPDMSKQLVNDLTKFNGFTLRDDEK